MKKIIENLITDLAKLNGVGEKTAKKYAYEILDFTKEDREKFLSDLKKLESIKKCAYCNNYTENEICDYCLEKSRDHQTMVVIAKAQDLEKIEFILPGKYIYYVLGGVIDPLIGINSGTLEFEKLFTRIKAESVQELILVLPSTNEGELTASYIRKKLAETQIKITKLAQGVPMGTSLEYLDEITLLQSLKTRQDY